jgi:hypothetical protein
MKTSELTGAALDWAVAQCEGFPVRKGFDDNCPEYSTDWSQGGPIIEREGLDVHCVYTGLWSAKWWANNSGMAKNPAQRFKQNIQTDGPTPLIAAMRCYVASKLGDEVEIPEELQC